MAYVDSADLGSSDPGKGAALVGLVGAGTLAQQLKGEKGNIIRYGAEGGATVVGVNRTGTDATAAIQAADDAGNVYTPEGNWFVTSTLVKNPSTHWSGGGLGRALQTGSCLVVDQSAMTTDTITIPSPGGTNISWEGRISDIRFETSELWSGLPADNGANITIEAGCRRLYFERLNLSGRRYGFFMGAVGGNGSLTFKDIFCHRNEYGYWLHRLADSRFENCVGGDGGILPGGTSNPFLGDVGYGFWLQTCNNTQFVGCRAQVSKNVGMYITDSVEILFDRGIVDQNNEHGVRLIDTVGPVENVSFTNTLFFDNGTDTVNGSGISISTGVTHVKDVRIANCHFQDRGQNPVGLRQDRGVHFAPVDAGIIENVLITGCDFTGVQNPISFGAQAIYGTNVIGLIVKDCPGVCGVNDFVTERGDQGATIDHTYGSHIVWDTSITANRQISLPTTRLASGNTRYRIERTINCLGNFRLRVVADGTEITALSAPGTVCEVIWDGAQWLVTEQPARHQASTADLESAASWINQSAFKLYGVEVWNFTNGTMHHAAASGNWKPVTYGTDVVPA